jgi:hypothetical protein
MNRSKEGRNSAFNPKSITPYDRVKEHPGEPLTVDISKALQAYSLKHHPVGENLPESTRIYRVKVVTALLKEGVPLLKVDKISSRSMHSLCVIRPS